jgi:hypothetical protein
MRREARSEAPKARISSSRNGACDVSGIVTRTTAEFWATPDKRRSAFRGDEDDYGRLVATAAGSGVRSTRGAGGKGAKPVRPWESV